MFEPDGATGRAGPPACAPRRPLLRLASRLARLGICVRIAAAPPPAERGGAPPGRLASAETAHRTLRELLTELTDGRVPPALWAIGRSRSGGPLVAGPEPGFHATIAYTGGIFAVAAAQRRRIGIDLEPDAPVPEEDVPLHLLSPGEAALVGRTPSAFLTVWTLKEALAKEHGEGLLADCRMHDAAPFADAASFALVPRPNGGAACHAALRSGDASYRLALAFGPLLR